MTLINTVPTKPLIKHLQSADLLESQEHVNKEYINIHFTWWLICKLITGDPPLKRRAECTIQYSTEMQNVAGFEKMR